jgi:O-antigen/teichoic acid export membrane protein
MPPPALIESDGAGQERIPSVGAPCFLLAAAKLSAANGIALGIGVASAPVLSRLFPPGVYGRFASYIALVAILGPLATGRFELGVYSVRGRIRRMDFAALSFGFAGLSALTGCLLAAVVALAGVIRGGDLLAIAAVMSGVTLSAGLATLTSLRVSGAQHARNATARVVQSTTQNALQILLGVTGLRSATGLVSGFLAGLVGAIAVTGGGLLAGVTRRLHPGRWGKLREYARFHVAFPARSGPAALVTAASLNAPVLLVTAGAGVAAGGELAMALRLLGAPLLALSLAAGQVALGVATRVAGSAPRELPGLVRQFTRQLAFTGFVLTALLVGVLAPLSRPLLGAEWGGVARYAAALAPFALAQFVGAPLLGLLQVIRRQDLELQISLCRLAGIIPLALLLVGPWAPLPLVAAYSLLTATAYAFGVSRLHAAIRRFAAKGQAVR